MRETEHPPRSRTPLLMGSPRDGQIGHHVLGRNEGTVRFLFGPNSAT